MKLTERELKAIINECINNMINEMDIEPDGPSIDIEEFEDCKLPNGKYCISSDGSPLPRAKSWTNCYKKGETFSSYREAPDGYFLATSSSGPNLPVFKHTHDSWMAVTWNSDEARFRVRKKDDGKTFFVSDVLMQMYSKHGLIKLELIDKDYIRKKREISQALNGVRASFDPSNPNPLIKNGTSVTFDFKHDEPEG